jgi:ubiquinol-cytochrome c reductase cytochrome c subunit
VPVLARSHRSLHGTFEISAKMAGERPRAMSLRLADIMGRLLICVDHLRLSRRTTGLASFFPRCGLLALGWPRACRQKIDSPSFSERGNSKSILNVLSFACRSGCFWQLRLGGGGMRSTAASACRGIIAFAIVSLLVLVYFATVAYLAPAPARSASLGASLHSAGLQTAIAPNAADLYQENCVPCHGSNGEGSDIAPSLKAAGSSALIEPKVSEGGGGMPVFANLMDEQQIQAVSDYVAQNVADPSTHGATDGEGSDVWRLYCTPCHGSTDALIDMQEGPGEMPVFAGSALTNRQQTAVALYLQDVIAQPPSPGGWGLGYLGPVPEGFFALFLGLGGLVVFARWAQGGGGDGDA